MIPIRKGVAAHSCRTNRIFGGGFIKLCNALARAANPPSLTAANPAKTPYFLRASFLLQRIMDCVTKPAL